jgi:hypothetical protein
MNSSRLKFVLKSDAFITGLSIFLLTCYYLLFLNRGLVPGDEGYYIHIAERILQGQVPYRDFFLQYPPGYLYLLAACFKLLGTTILTGRISTLVICLGIFGACLKLLRLFGVSSVRATAIALLSIAAFGYPLNNTPLVVWPTVLLTEFSMIFLLYWIKTLRTKYLLVIGLCVGLLFFTKQNIAIVDAILINAILPFSRRGNFKETLKSMLLMNGVWIGMTGIWVYYFFFRNNLPGLLEFLSFNHRYLAIYPFSYPPLTFLLQPLGFFKLLPYYLPIVFLALLLLGLLRRRTGRSMLVLLLPIAGFFTTVYPTSDLLHVYPYFGLVLVSFLIFIYSQFLRFQKLFYLLIFFCIISGFYLTLFREYNRGQAPYIKQNTPLQVPRAKGMLVDSTAARNINTVYSFINSHTKAHDYIFVYSFSPMIYFLLERQNPSRYSIYSPGYLTTSQEQATIHDIQEKKVRYIVADWQADFRSTRPLPAWISKKKKLLQNSQYSIVDLQKEK